jgi:hypothetical protein
MNLWLAAVLLFVSDVALAQVPPYVYGPTIGTASVQILPVNPLRKRTIFFNPNATALVAVCPSGPTRVSGGVAVVAAINGAGCITLLPQANMTIDGGAGPSQLYMPSAWVGVASAGGSALTVLEFE